jgi:hypothetical protein
LLSRGSKDCARVRFADAAMRLRVNDCTAEIIQERRRNDELELPALEGPQHIRGGPGRREKAGDDDVRVEGRLHASALRCRVLCWASTASLVDSTRERARRFSSWHTAPAQLDDLPRRPAAQRW